MEREHPTKKIAKNTTLMAQTSRKKAVINSLSRAAVHVLAVIDWSILGVSPG